LVDFRSFHRTRRDRANVVVMQSSAAWPSRSEGYAESKDPYFHMYRERKTYCVYVMGSLTGTLYIGITSNLMKRVFQHKFHRIDGFTDQYDVERFLYRESFDDVHKAIARERQLKGWRRSKKIALIELVNPHWLDLAGDWFPGMKDSGKDSGKGRGASTAQNDPLRGPSCSAQHDKE
jgi:putative endonuclease